MRIPKLKIVGICTGPCEKEVEVEIDSLGAGARKHRFRSRWCKGSDYSVRNPRFVIQTEEEALAVATFLRDDNPHKCLRNPSFGHSLDCGDSIRCQETRQKLARAFAEYYLANHCEEIDINEAA